MQSIIERLTSILNLESFYTSDLLTDISYSIPFLARQKMPFSIEFILMSIESLLLVITRFILYSIKGYLAFYILSCCHEVLEDHREGTVNARSKWINTLISSIMLTLTAVGLYGVFTSHFGLFLTWLLLKPVVRIFELESAVWTTLAMSVIASGWTLCYWTYETISTYSSSLVF